MSRIRRHLSYANVAATLALVIALGAGTVYAAGHINGKSVKKGTLPGNRVKKGTLPGNRLKNGTVKGSKIVESSLGQVPSAKLADSAGAARGVFQDDAIDLIGNINNRVATLSLADGKYAINAKLVLHNNDGSSPANNVECFLYAGENFSDYVKAEVPANGDVAVPFQTITYFPRANSVALDCNDHGGSVVGEFARITAIQVADVTYGPSPPAPPNNVRHGG